MENEYTVGALCDFIATKKKQSKVINKIKDENVENQHQSEISLQNLPKNKTLKRPKGNVNELSRKKQKVNENTKIIQQNEEKTIDIKSETIINNNQTINPKLLTSLKKTKNKKQIIDATDSEAQNQSKIFQKTIRKKKNTKSIDIPAELNNETKVIEKKNLTSKLSCIKSSEEYLEKESRTVFVGNIPVNIKMSAIKSLFKQFGDIETTRFRSVAVKNISKPKRASVIKRDFHPQRDTANVYVRFKTIAQAQSALSLNATQFEGHTIRVDMALNTFHKQDKKKGVFIGNLPYSIQEDEVWNFFKDSGVISAVRIVRDNATGVSKGFGYVDFETKESVELAMQLQGKTIQNREIRIKRIETKTNLNIMTNQTPISFKKTRPIGRNGHQFQGKTMKPKMQKKKQKLTKTDLMRKKIAKQLKA